MILFLNNCITTEKLGYTDLGFNEFSIMRKTNKTTFVRVHITNNGNREKNVDGTELVSHRRVRVK